MTKSGNGKNGATKCTEEVIKLAHDYLENFKDHGDQIPSYAGLSGVIKVHRDTLRKWIKYAKEPERVNDELLKEMAGILEQINAEQERVLINKGLSNEFNSQITKLMLGKHGYHDKQDQTLASPDGGPVKTQNQFVFNPVGPDYEPTDKD